MQSHPIPLVCLPGWGVSTAIWDSLFARLQGRLSMQAIDLPGQGDSPAGPQGLDAWTQSILGAAPERAVYMGWSLGGLVCLNVACRHPRRMAGLIVVDALPRMLRGDDWPWGMSADGVAQTARGLERDFATTLRQFLQLQVFSEPGAWPMVTQLQRKLLASPPDQQGLLNGLDILHEADLREAVATIDAPTLIINGHRDRMCHPDGARWLAERIPGAQSWIVPDAAHAPFLSSEDDFAGRIAGFMADISRDVA